MRSEDYYHQLYEDYNKKFYKGEYEDDFDEIADHDKRPIFYEENSSSESETEKERHLVSDQKYLDHINSMHKNQKFAANRDELRQKQADKPKYGRVDNNRPVKKYVEKDRKEEP